MSEVPAPLKYAHDFLMRAADGELNKAEEYRVRAADFRTNAAEAEGERHYHTSVAQEFRRLADRMWAEHQLQQRKAIDAAREAEAEPAPEPAWRPPN